MTSLDLDLKVQFVAKMLSHWKYSEQIIISMEKEIYAEFFPFLMPHDVVKDKQQNIIFLLFKREEAIEQIKAHYQLQDSLSGKLLHRDSE